MYIVLNHSELSINSTTLWMSKGCPFRNSSLGRDSQAVKWKHTHIHIITLYSKTIKYNTLNKTKGRHSNGTLEKQFLCWNIWSINCNKKSRSFGWMLISKFSHCSTHDPPLTATYRESRWRYSQLRWETKALKISSVNFHYNWTVHSYRK